MFNLEQVIHQVEELIDGNELVNAKTRYFNSNGEPEDIIGCWLSSHSKSLDDLVLVNAHKIGKNNIQSAQYIAFFELNSPVPISNSAKKFLNELQYAQDIGNTWGEALERALELIPKPKTREECMINHPSNHRNLVINREHFSLLEEQDCE